MGLLDSILAGQGGGLFGSNFASPLFDRPEMPQYDAMGNYTGITPQAQSPFPVQPIVPGSLAPSAQPSIFNGGIPTAAFSQFAGIPVAPSSPGDAALPPNAQPTAGAAPPLPISQVPPAPQPAQTAQQPAPQAAPEQTPPVFLQPKSSGGFGGAAQGFLANAHTGPIGAILGALGGAAGMGQGNPQDIARQNQKAQYEAYQAAGLSPAQAMIATMNPKIAEQFMAPKFEKVGPGENLVSVGGPGGPGKTVATGGPEKPPAGYEYVDAKDPSKGLKGIAGGPATHLPAETAGRLAMMETAAADLPSARKVLMQGRGPQGTGLGGAAASYSKVGETGRAQRTVRVAIEGALRAMSGANAPKTEVDNYEGMFMPSPFDSPETAKQKLDLLDNFISNARRMVTQGRGPAATPVQGNLPNGWSVSVR